MKILITLLLIFNAHAQEQKYVDISNIRQFNFGQCNGIEGNKIPKLSDTSYTKDTCQQAYLKADICTIEANKIRKAFSNTNSCNSWLKVRTRGCKTFIKREARKCGGRGKYSKNNFFNPQAKTHTGVLKTKDILSYSKSEHQIEQQRIAAAKERERLAKLEQQRIAAAKERERLAKLEQQKKNSSEKRTPKTGRIKAKTRGKRARGRRATRISLIRTTTTNYTK